jgi:hypothetical protein
MMSGRRDVRTAEIVRSVPICRPFIRCSAS